MNRKPFLKPMLQAAVLALCTTAIGAVPMVAQDNSAPNQQQDQAGPRDGPRGGPGHREAHQLEFLTKQLNLTPDQVTQVKAIEDDSRKQAMAVRDDTSIARQDKRAKMIEIRKGAQDKIRELLTEEQKPKFDAIQARRQGRDPEQGGPPPPQD